MARRNEPVIIDVEPVNKAGSSDIFSFVPSSEKKDYKSFAWGIFKYGFKMTANFIGWSVKETAKMAAEGFKVAMDGNKELAREMSANRPRYVSEEHTIRSKRSMFYIPTKEEEEVERRLSVRKKAF